MSVVPTAGRIAASVRSASSQARASRIREAPQRQYTIGATTEFRDGKVLAALSPNSKPQSPHHKARSYPVRP